jgi:hypothetical protein
MSLLSIHTVQFAVILVLQIPSIAVSLLIFVYFVRNRQIRSQLNHRIILVLLAVNFLEVATDLPMPLSFYHTSMAKPSTNSYCVWWTWYEFSLNTVCLFLMAWASIERHILIFSSHWMQGRWKRRALHIAPIIFCLLWTPLFYVVMIIISPHCSTIWRFDSVLCGQPCYLTTNNGVFGSFDFSFNILVPIVIIVLANFTLIFRVVYGKYTRHQPIIWRRQRKLTLQMVSISILYVIFWFPSTLTQLVEIYFNSEFLLVHLESLLFLIYFVPLLLPFVCLVRLTKLMKQMRTYVIQMYTTMARSCHRASVHPLAYSN